MKKKKLQFLEIMDRHRDRSAVPECPHFGQCGGCLMQDISYEAQCAIKVEYINSLMGGIYPIGSIVSAGPYRYRNRMDYVTAFGKLGLRRAGRYRDVIDLSSCAILQERSEEAFKNIRPLLSGIEDYDYLHHTGYLRYLVLRQGRFTGEVMANLVVATREERLHETVKAIDPFADSISIILSEGKADLSFGEILCDVKRGYIEESFDGIRFRITPNSFFQSNSEIALLLYRRIRDEVSGGRVLDLYSGVGSISLYAAQKASRVTGVEIIEESVRNAELNRSLNGIDNVDFVLADALPWVKEHALDYDTIILDPPRAGMNPRVLKYLNAGGAPRIVYVSCNPSSLAGDLTALDNYRLVSFEAFDMFPQTLHVETLAVLVRKDG